jgi:thiosulfate/3-mercaptopyruvate sulfurtransferase
LPEDTASYFAFFIRNPAAILSMPYTTLISSEALLPHLDEQGWAIVDCRFSLQDPERGRHAYRQAHLPGAVYAHLDEDLCGPIVPGITGRHPLPSVAQFARTLSRWGITTGVQVVAYDDAGGTMAARLWWMLQWMGHEAVAVLDGGWPHWKQDGHPTRSDAETRMPAVFVPHPRPELIVTADEVETLRQHPEHRLLDARGVERYRGVHEPIDPVAGHIPGALSAPYLDNLDADGRFQSPEALRTHYAPLIEDIPTDHLSCYCGSGVTAAHTVLAFAHAGLGLPRLYVGSWSEWITDPERPIAQG